MLDEKAYDSLIDNKYLGLQKRITGDSPLEIRIKTEFQTAKWNRLEELQKERERMESLKELAEFNARQAENTIKACQNILKLNICSDTKLDWASFYDDRLLPPFVFQDQPPRYEQVARQMQVPRRSFFSELLFPSLKKKRLALEEAAGESFEEQMREYKRKKDSALAGYETQRLNFLNEQTEYNRTVDKLQLDVEKGQPGAVASLVRIALAQLELPDAFETDFDAHYYRPDRLIVVSCILPGPLEMPRVVGYEYHGEEKGISPVEMGEAAFNDFYESTMLQITLSAVHRIFTSIPDRQIRMLGFNGLTGEGKACILTCKISRDLFASIDLARNEPATSFQAMHGVITKPLTGLTPVEPLAKPAISVLRNIETDETAAKGDGLQKPAAYRPGDIKNAANNILVSLLDELEQDLSKSPGDKDVIH